MSRMSEYDREFALNPQHHPFAANNRRKAKTAILLTCDPENHMIFRVRFLPSHGSFSRNGALSGGQSPLVYRDCFKSSLSRTAPCEWLGAHSAHYRSFFVADCQRQPAITRLQVMYELVKFQFPQDWEYHILGFDFIIQLYVEKSIRFPVLVPPFFTDFIA